MSAVCNISALASNFLGAWRVSLAWESCSLIETKRLDVVSDFIFLDWVPLSFSQRCLTLRLRRNIEEHEPGEGESQILSFLL